MKKLVKGLAVALPMMTLAACSSTEEATDQSAVESNQASTQQAAAAQGTGVETGAVSPVLPAGEVNKSTTVPAYLAQEHTIYFDFDKTSVKAAFAELLTSHANFLVDNPTQSVLIEGHADERGTPEYNIALGERRAKAVAKYLQSLGVQAAQIKTVSYGEEKPIDHSHTEAGFAKNRRAVLVY